MISSERLTVHYSLLLPTAPAAACIADYDEQCAAFVEQASQLVRRYGADSAALIADFGYHVHGLHFTDETAPLSFDIQPFGHFYPTRALDRLAFDFRLPYLSMACPSLPMGARYGHLGDQIVLAVTPNKDGTRCRIVAADPMDDATFAAMALATAKDNQKHLATLDHVGWLPPALEMARAFNPSPAIRVLNNERWNYHFNGHKWRYRRPVRAIKKLCAFVGRAIKAPA